MKKPVVSLILLFVSSATAGCTQLYPIDRITLQEVAPQSDNTILVNIEARSGQYVRHVDTQSDRIVVTFERCKYCKDGGQLKIANPDDLPIYFADDTVSKQVYPVNEFANDGGVALE